LNGSPRALQDALDIQRREHKKKKCAVMYAVDLSIYEFVRAAV
jgi:hypothetical protein